MTLMVVIDTFLKSAHQMFEHYFKCIVPNKSSDSKSIVNLHPTKSVSNLHPTKSVSNLHPTKSVSNLHPTKFVANLNSTKLDKSFAPVGHKFIFSNMQQQSPSISALVIRIARRKDIAFYACPTDDGDWGQFVKLD
jgi:hypothetical protein